MKFGPMAIPAMALPQQHDSRRDILFEPAARRRAAIEARGHLELGVQSGHKNQPACVCVCHMSRRTEDTASGKCRSKAAGHAEHSTSAGVDEKAKTFGSCDNWQTTRERATAVEVTG